MTNGYVFYFSGVLGDTVLTFPITPGELSITVGSKNETVTLIDDGDINILKSPSLTDIKFTARFPMRNYPYVGTYTDFKGFFDKLKELKEQRASFRFIVARTTPNGKRTWDTNLLVSLEEFTLNESADEGDDVLMDIVLKQFKDYGVKILSSDTYGITRPKAASNSNKNSSTSKYTVKANDCLYNIAKAAYDDGSKWPIIYEANKNVIEETAKKYRNGKGSSNGHWIYPGTVLIIPGVNGANLTVDKLKGKSSGKVDKVASTIKRLKEENDKKKAETAKNLSEARKNQNSIMVKGDGSALVKYKSRDTSLTPIPIE